MDQLERDQRAAVIAEALTWRGTPFAHRSMVKGGGVDCAMLIQEIFRTVGVIDERYTREYSNQWHLHRDEERYLEWANHLAVEVPQPRMADVAIWRFGRCFSHAGLIIDDEHVLHAFADTGYVAIDPMRTGRLSHVPTANGPMLRPVRFFDVWARKRPVPPGPP